MKRLILIVASVFALLVIVACGSGGGSDNARPIDNVSTQDSSSSSPEAKALQASSGALTVKDFEVAIKVKSKECIAGYGCNVTYEVQVAVDKKKLAKDGHSYEVTYEVRGGKDGPQTGTITMDSEGTYDQFDDFVVTNSRSTGLKPHITIVERQAY